MPKHFSLNRNASSLELGVLDEPVISEEQKAILAQTARVSEARGALQRTDYVVIKSLEQNKPVSPTWLAWRDQLREVVRGNLSEIAPEPERYNAP